MHRLVAQQIAKATNAAGAVDIDRLAELVSNAYEEHDRDRRRTARSMSLMIEEIDAINHNLERAVVARTKELRAREADLQAQNMRFDAAVSNMSQGLVMFDASPARHPQPALHRHVPPRPRLRHARLRR